jgi:hypothetical protein
MILKKAELGRDANSFAVEPFPEDSARRPR